MREILIQLISAYLGALGFSLLFGLHKRHLFLAALGGMMSWGVRLLVQAFVPVPFLSGALPHCLWCLQSSRWYRAALSTMP